MTDLDKLMYFSELNVMKRSDTFDSEQITYSSAGNDSQLPIDHNLGYIPFFVAGAELFNDGIIWSNNYVHEYTESSITGASNVPPNLFYWCNNTQLTINLRNGFGTGFQSGVRNVYYGVYLDYA